MNKELGLSVSLEVESGENDCKLLNIVPQPLSVSCLLLPGIECQNEGEEDKDTCYNNASMSDTALEYSQPHIHSLLVKLARHSFHKISKNKKIISTHLKSSESKMNKDQNWSPTPIQLQSWPILTSNVSLNLIAIAPTGSGKTLSFTIPLVLKGMVSATSSIVEQGTRNNIIEGLVLTPTRELAIQVSKVVALVCKSANKLMKEKFTKSDLQNTTIMKSVVIYGGVDKTEQINSLIGNDTELRRQDNKNFNHANTSMGESICNSTIFVTATPGRLLDIMCLEKQGSSHEKFNNTSSTTSIHKKSDDNKHSLEIREMFCTLSHLIIDEADRMATQTDISKQVDSILNFLKMNQRHNENITVGMFSATLPQRASEKFNDWVSKPRCIVKVDSIIVGSNRQQTDHEDEVFNNKEGTIIKDKEKVNTIYNQNEENEITPSTGKRKNETPRGPLNLSLPPSHVEQILHVCSNHKKPKKLMTTLKKIRDNEKKDTGKSRRKGLIIVFFSRIKTLQYIHQLLKKENVECVQIHSQMKQDKREYQLNLFRSGKNPLLLATDIAARGIHINNVEYIINYDFPASLEQYVHRCGRAGRNKVTKTPKDHDSGAGKSVTCNIDKNSTVYSFFHRELQAMAKDVVELLRSCNAFVDPNLLSLIPASDNGDRCNKTSRSKKRKLNKKGSDRSDSSVVKLSNKNKIETEMESDENEEFACLQFNRIVLKRASHVSDAESDSE